MARTNPDELATRVMILCRKYLRPPAGYATDDGTGDPILDFLPALTVAEQATYDRLLAVARAQVPMITPAEWQNIEPDIANVKAFLQAGSPTLAQNVTATKSIIRILAALLKA